MGYISLELQGQLNTLMLPVLVLIGLAFAVCADSYVDKRIRMDMLAIEGSILTLIAANCIESALLKAWDPAYITLKTALSVYGYVCRPVIIVLFIYLVWDHPKRRLFWILPGIDLAVYMTAFFRPWTFHVSEEGSFYRGPLGYTAHIVSLILLLSQMVIALDRFWYARSMARLVFVANTAVAGLGILMDSRCFASGTITFTEISAVFSIVFYYIWLHLEFVKEHEQALVADQRIQIMMSQIQPHFLYNTLTTIQALCLDNPKKAASVTEQFASYLRQNIDSLDRGNLIPFRKELEHTLVYARIEMARFPNIHLDYEIEDEDFYLPALTVQPVVENAIRHGVRGLPKGQIDIITNLLPDCHEILICDNGRGFTAEEASAADGPHIGIQNVRERLHRLCRGSLTIESKEGGGTRVIIRIPRGKEEP